MACFLSLCNIIDIMSIYSSLFDKINAISLYIICNPACVKFVAYADVIINIIKFCFSPLRILGCILTKVGIFKPVVLLFKMYGMVLKHCVDRFKKLRICGGDSAVVAYAAGIWKTMTLSPLLSTFVSGDIKNVILILHRPALLGLVSNSISRVVSLPFNLMILLFKLLFSDSYKIAINRLRMIYNEALNGWKRMILSSSICQKLERKVVEANREVEEMEKDLGCQLEQAQKRAQNEIKRRREASHHSTTQIRQAYEQLAMVEEELRSKSVQIENLENRLYEDKPSECWRGWEVKREEVVEEQRAGPYCTYK